MFLSRALGKENESFFDSRLKSAILFSVQSSSSKKEKENKSRERFCKKSL